MTDTELRAWLAVTRDSRYRWTEDEITRLNGRGALYYYGGEDGIYMRIQPDGKLSIGTYEGALPHIGEAFLTPKASMDCGDFDRALQSAMEFGGTKFLVDLFSGFRPKQPHHKEVTQHRKTSPSR